MRRVEVFTDGKILSPLRDPARQIAIHLVDGAEEIAHRRESSRRHNFVEIRDLEDVQEIQQVEDLLSSPARSELSVMIGLDVGGSRILDIVKIGEFAD